MAHRVIGTWVIDDNNNYASIELWGSEVRAAQTLETLQDCTFCIDCNHLVDCHWCRDCRFCLSCFGCIECSKTQHLRNYVNNQPREQL